MGPAACSCDASCCARAVVQRHDGVRAPVPGRSGLFLSLKCPRSFSSPPPLQSESDERRRITELSDLREKEPLAGRLPGAS